MALRLWLKRCGFGEPLGCGARLTGSSAVLSACGALARLCRVQRCGFGARLACAKSAPLDTRDTARAAIYTSGAAQAVQIIDPSSLVIRLRVRTALAHPVSAPTVLRLMLR